MLQHLDQANMILKIAIQKELERIYPKIKQAKKAGDLNTKSKLDLEKSKLDSDLNKLEIKLADKEKRSTSGSSQYDSDSTSKSFGFELRISFKI
jgi:hypothetical protein